MPGNYYAVYSIIEPQCIVKSELYPEQSPTRLNDTAEILISLSLILIHSIYSGKNPQKF